MFFFFSSRRRHTRSKRDWSSDVCSSDLAVPSKSVPLSSEGSKKVSEKTKAIDAAILQIEKQFGKGSIMKLGAEGTQSIDVIPSGSLALDLALGVGGYP